MNRSRALSITAWFLAVSYVVGAPVMMALEFWSHGPSQRFGYPPEFIYLVGVLQTLGGVAMLWRPLASWAAAGLAVLMIGAIGTHLSVGRPLAAIPAFGYLALLLWFGWQRRGEAPGIGNRQSHVLSRGERAWSRRAP